MRSPARETRMSSVGIERQVEAEDLARTKEMIGSILAAWDLLAWNELLADDIVLSLGLGKAAISRISELRGCSDDHVITGQEHAGRVLSGLCGGLRRDLSVTTEVISGHHVILLGKLVTHKAGHDVECLPVVIYMALNSERKIRNMTIASVDLRTLADAIRCTGT
jgi:hypothetical protein